ncbi:cytochrome P450 [uncultured Boseongicola sp.]|uniref:cytochrome P450 n=1 Tax=uncultured Boseongicola sp. TaxID=1648499 RepID=UPI00260CEDE4|nr:cytochrome P450 [uncultured Boseongicola sp.]
MSPWHLHRSDRFWATLDAFDADRWETDAWRQSSREAYLPFSSGAWVCPGGICNGGSRGVADGGTASV